MIDYNFQKKKNQKNRSCIKACLSCKSQEAHTDSRILAFRLGHCSMSLSLQSSNLYTLDTVHHYPLFFEPKFKAGQHTLIGIFCCQLVWMPPQTSEPSNHTHTHCQHVAPTSDPHKSDWNSVAWQTKSSWYGHTSTQRIFSWFSCVKPLHAKYMRRAPLFVHLHGFPLFS